MTEFIVIGPNPRIPNATPKHKQTSKDIYNSVGKMVWRGIYIIIR